MQGYLVVTHVGEQVVGHVVEKVGRNFIVEQGMLRKTKHAVPEDFAQLDEAGRRLVVTVPKDLLHDSPEVNGDVDEDAVAAHYGLAESPALLGDRYDDTVVERDRES